MENTSDREGKMIAFGPVPSRRLGRSLGVNNIPPKICSYSCIYCQLGRTLEMGVERRTYFGPERVFKAVEEKVRMAEKEGERIDHITFVPDGEPTLDMDLGRSISKVKELGIDVAVITNSSLLWREDVREDLSLADHVSIKMDTVDKEVWKRLDRPCGGLRLEDILEGARKFSKMFRGTLETETMIVNGVNDDAAGTRSTADVIGEIGPSKAYISVPTRPPAESWVSIPSEGALNEIYHIFGERIKEVEFLIEYEGDQFSSVGDVDGDLLSITSVHPMREDAVNKLIMAKGADISLVAGLVKEGYLKRMIYNGDVFYLRNLRKKM